ncbi:MAG: hypothetical protein KDD35_07260, partial [Bdellovibrionales bacterium]|nr:hypothetical protein [Bdellovibrionales bacterium]
MNELFPEKNKSRQNRFLEVVKQLDSRVLMPKTAPGLAKTQQALSRLHLNYPEQSRQTILVAGTNGKGTVCRCLEHFLLAAGQKTFLFTSPHLISLRERLRINGRSVSEDEFVYAFEAIDPLTNDLGLSHFETLTIMAAWLAFRSPLGEEKDHWFIWEVGLGGTWDSTNAIPHGTSVITSISYDHQDLLGNTLEEIAENKMGILQKQNLVIHSPTWPDSILRLFKTKQNQGELEAHTAKLPLFKSRTSFPRSKDFLEIQGKRYLLPENGPRFAENIMISLEALTQLKVPIKAGLETLESYYWPGRGDILTSPDFQCSLLLSGDHNIAGINSLIEILQNVAYRKAHLLVGIGLNKDGDEMLRLLEKLPRSQITLIKSPFRGRSHKEF